MTRAEDGEGATVPALGDTVDILGMPVTRLSRFELIDHMIHALSQGSGGWVITANLDYLQRFVSDRSSATLYQLADLIVADGVPLLLASHLLGKPLPDRVAGSDLVWLLGERAAQHGYSIYFLGAEPGVAQEASIRFLERWPNLHIAGFSSPMVSENPNGEEIHEIRSALLRASPDIVYVALGAPKEERLIAALRSSFPETWWIGVGISLSFVAGGVARAPLWMQRCGIEWLHRLAQEPRRLWRRYLLRNLPFAGRLLMHSWRNRSGISRSRT